MPGRLSIAALLLSAGLACDTGRDTSSIARRHIQLASQITRGPLDDAEIAWRATHNDLCTGRVPTDALRAANPGTTCFEYLNVMHLVLHSQAAAYAAANGWDAEDFYLHYREDYLHPYYPATVIVPGFPPGLVPGWNPSWQPGDPPASATARSQSRVIGVSRWDWPLANLAHPGYRAFLKTWAADILRGSAWGAPAHASGPSDGILMDEAIYYPQFNIGRIDKSSEYYGVPLDDAHPHPNAFLSMYAEVQAHVRATVKPGAVLLVNYGHQMFLSHPSPFAQGIQAITGAALAEVWMQDRVDGHIISYEDDYATGIAGIVSQARAGGTRVLGAFDLSGGMGGTDRGRLYTLALYYLVHGANTWYAYKSVELAEPAVPISQWQWNPAVTADVGVADGEHYVHASGADPFVPSLTYRVLARKFSGALVLAKMLPKGSVTDDRSATTHALGRPYALLNGDGTKGAVVTQVTLRNNEGAILLDP